MYNIFVLSNFSIEKIRALSILKFCCSYRKLENPTQNLEKRDNKQRRLVILYTILSFGCPAIVTIITAVLQLAEEDVSDEYKPARYGVPISVAESLTALSGMVCQSVLLSL
jgi:hypothetical protein